MNAGRVLRYKGDMPERMADVVQSIAEAIHDADGDRIRRLLDPDARLDSAADGHDLTVDEFVKLHTVRRPYWNWQMTGFEPLDAVTAVVSASVTLRLEKGLALRRAVYLWRFRDGKVLRVTTHASPADAVDAWAVSPQA